MLLVELSGELSHAVLAVSVDIINLSFDGLAGELGMKRLSFDLLVLGGVNTEASSPFPRDRSMIFAILSGPSLLLK
jgi:hypothetical protein